MATSLIGLLTVAVFGLAGFALALRYGPKVWDRVYRRGQAQSEALQENLARMFKETPLTHCQALVYGAAGLAAAAALLLTWSQGIWLMLGVTLPAAWLASRLPGLVVKKMYRRWMLRLDDQLVDALTLVTNALRSGLSLVQSLDLVVKEMPAPISLEFGLAMKEHRMGARLDEALERLVARAPSQDLAMVVDSVVILRETGGNLTETFDTIVYTIAERKRVQGKIRSLTAQGYYQGMILMGMPVILTWGLYALNPDYMRPLLTTIPGWILLALVAGMLTCAAFVIRRIISIDV